jgi:hypothetical protein
MGLSLVKPSRDSGVDQVDLNSSPSLPKICSSYSSRHHVIGSEKKLKFPLARGKNKYKKST